MKWIRINKIIVDIDKINYFHAFDRNESFYLTVKTLDETLVTEFESAEERDEAMDDLMDELNE